MRRKGVTALRIAGAILVLFGIGIIVLSFLNSDSPAFTILGVDSLIWVGISQLVAGILLFMSSFYIYVSQPRGGR